MVDTSSGNTMRPPQAQMLGLAVMCMAVFDSSVIGLLPLPDCELARRACARDASGTTHSQCAGRASPRGCSRTAHLCLRGGADDAAHDKEGALLRGGKRPRRPDGVLDANYVESLHSVMARADAAKLMHVRCIPKYFAEVEESLECSEFEC